jgi:hypothetical protein
MAMKKIELSEEERKAMGQSFISLDAIGQRFKGRVSDIKPQSGQFARAGQFDYVFRYANPAEGQPGHRADQPLKAVCEATLKSYTDVSAKLRKANVQKGWIVQVTYVSDLSTGRDNPMKIFEVEIDDSPAPAAATVTKTPAQVAAEKAAADAVAKAAAAKAAAAPAASAEPSDDIPF